MTVFGKILVFINLLFSLLVGGLIVAVFITRTNWYDGYKKLEQRYQVAKANAETYAGEAASAEKRRVDETTKLQERIDELGKQVAMEQANLAAAQAQLNDERQKLNASKVTMVSGTEELQRREQEVKKLEDQLKTSNDRYTTVVQEMNKLRDRAVAAEIESSSLKSRNSSMIARLEDLSKQLAKIKANGGNATLVATRNPPPENVKGLIKAVDSSGLMTITIGSDAGLDEGNTLEVFSLNPAKYKGTVRILAVRPNEAVAKPISRLSAPAQAGDQVWSKILGGN